MQRVIVAPAPRKRTAEEREREAASLKRQRAEPQALPLALLQEMRETAYNSSTYPVERTTLDDMSSFLLVPAFVDTDHSEVGRGVHEQLLWRWGGAFHTFQLPLSMNKYLKPSYICTIAPQIIRTQPKHGRYKKYSQLGKTSDIEIT